MLLILVIFGQFGLYTYIYIYVYIYIYTPYYIPPMYLPYRQPCFDSKLTEALALQISRQPRQVPLRRIAIVRGPGIEP